MKVSERYTGAGTVPDAAPAALSESVRLLENREERSGMVTPPPQRLGDGVTIPTLKNLDTDSNGGVRGRRFELWCDALKEEGKNKQQERDFWILRLCYEQRVVIVGHLVRYVFQGLNERVARRVLARLENEGLIQRSGALRIGTHRLVKLTPAGTGRVEAATAVRISQGQKTDNNTLIHDACVTATRLRLEELWDGHWIPEALLKSEEFPQIPDGLWIFPNGNRVAIEVERSKKDFDRFHKLQERWRAVEIRLVLYVTVGEAAARRVRRYVETGPKDLPFGVIKLEELEMGTPRVWTCLRELELLTRRTF